MPLEQILYTLISATIASDDQNRSQNDDGRCKPGRVDQSLSRKGISGNGRANFQRQSTRNTAVRCKDNRTQARI